MTSKERTVTARRLFDHRTLIESSSAATVTIEMSVFHKFFPFFNSILERLCRIYRKNLQNAYILAVMVVKNDSPVMSSLVEHRSSIIIILKIVHFVFIELSSDYSTVSRLLFDYSFFLRFSCTFPEKHSQFLLAFLKNQ